MNSFKDVEYWYNNTKPINEREHGTTRDLRPIGRRSYKHERIIKLSDNCYALSDGYVYPEGMADKITKMCVPILWQRTRDGREKVTIRAGFGNQCNGRYEFLVSRLPIGIDFQLNMFGQSKHGVRINAHYGYNPNIRFTKPREEYHLPNQAFSPWALVRYDNNSANYHSNLRTNDPERYKRMTTDDRKLLTFSREIGTYDWTLESKPHKIERKGTRVKKSEKQKYKAALEEFREYCYTIGIMLPQEPRISAGTPMELREKLMEDYQNHVKLQRKVIAGEQPVRAYYWGGEHEWVGLTPELVRAVITDPEHEARVALVTNVWRGAGWYNCDWSDESDRKTALARYNNYINRIAGFTKPVTRKSDK